MSTVEAQASGRVGNGGGAMVCRHPVTRKIISAEFYDLWEAKHLHGLTIDQRFAARPARDQAEIALMRFPDYRAGREFTTDGLTDIWRMQRPIQKGYQLVLVSDSAAVIQKLGCAYEQLANYTEDDEILYDPEIYAKLSNTDKAALDVHETIYAGLRRLENASDSRRARRITAALFSTLDTSPPVDSSSDASHIDRPFLMKCETDYEMTNKMGWGAATVTTEFSVFVSASDMVDRPMETLIVFKRLGVRGGQSYSFDVETAQVPAGVFATNESGLCTEVGPNPGSKFECNSWKDGQGFANWAGRTESNLDGGRTQVILNHTLEPHWLKKDSFYLSIELPKIHAWAALKCEGERGRL